MAWFSWRFVETPFRSKVKINHNSIFFGSFFCLMIFIIIGYLTHKNIDIHSDWTSDVRQHECLLQGDAETQHSLSCYEDDSGILLWGDSHAASLSIGLAERYSGRIPFTQLTQSACPPILYLEVLITRKTCNSVNQSVLNDIRKSNYRKVILHAAWVHNSYPMTAEKFREKISFTLNELQKIEGIQIVLVGNVPRWKVSPYQLDKFENEYVEINEIKYYRDSPIIDIDEIMLDLQRKYRFDYFSPIKSACIYDSNIRYCPLSLKRDLFYVDSGHLSRLGSEYIVSSLGELFSPTM